MRGYARFGTLAGLHGLGDIDLNALSRSVATIGNGAVDAYGAATGKSLVSPTTSAAMHMAATPPTPWGTYLLVGAVVGVGGYAAYKLSKRK